MEKEWVSNQVERSILETLKGCQERQEPPLIWATEVAKCLASRNIGLPSSELGQLLINHLCFHNNHPSLWKFLEQAISSALLSPLQLLSLLTPKVIPNRRSQPEAYRLYLELFTRHALSFDQWGTHDFKHKVTKSVDNALNLSQTYGVRVLETGLAFVLSFFSTVIALIDSTMDDWGLNMTSLDIQSGALGSPDYQNNMDIDSIGSYNIQKNEYRQRIRRNNSFMAIEVLAKLTESRKAIVLLRLVHLNMPEKFNGLLQRLQFLEANNSASPNLKSANQLMARLSTNVRRVLGFEYQLNKRQLIGMLIGIGSCRPLSSCDSEARWSSCWVSLDIYMENAMDGRQLPVTSAILVLAEIITTLQVFNRASWQDTFLALWLSALRLVQRERDPLEGPVPHLEARLCVLLSIVPLAIANVLQDEARYYSSSLHGVTASSYMETGNRHAVDGKDHASRKCGLIASLQVLENFSALLCPPASVLGAANSAAAKAVRFISNSKYAKDGLGSGSPGDTFFNAGGNMRHLIVEACIARNLIDTSAYFWPGYVSASVISESDISSVHKSPWSTFMEGAPLNGPLINLLFTTPASSLAEIERLYHIAVNGSAEEKPAAAKILCGASLSRGWNIQEHVVHFVVKLLSPPISPGYTGPVSHLVDHMPMLSAILFGASSIDSVHILSLYGVVPEVAASLMPLCETFGSLIPTSINKSSSDDEPSIYMVFSAAFLFLLRLWKFYRPPLEQCITGGVNGGQLTLEYLLLLRNSRIASHNSAARDEMNSNLNQLEFASDKPIYIDYYPKLTAWYCQNKSCIASTLSGLCSGNPVHEVANKIISMIYGKMTSGASLGNSSTPSSSSLSGSPASTGEDAYQRPMLPAWEVLEAIPFVLEAILTAYAHGRLSSRDLITGLRDLVDFLPASIAAIISYFNAEVTRGIWKPVPMNGTDWPSPVAILPSVESEMKEILAAAGVNIPCISSGLSPLVLPLPIAALVSLTITFKLTKSLEYIHAVVGPALESCASGCPWLNSPIIGSLWAQKVRRWHDFIVVSCCRSVFRQKEAVDQLLRSCFTSFLGSLRVSTSSLTKASNVNGLLGSVVAAPGAFPTIAPGFLYLRSCRTIHNVHYVNDLIVGLVAEYAWESAAKWASTDFLRLKSSQASLSLATAKAREVATLGASLICATGGFHLVQKLYQETIPTWLLSSREEKRGKVSAVGRIMEGYTMAYMLVLSGSFVFGVGAKPPSWAIPRRARIVGVHLDFLARVLDGNLSLGCDPATWKAYVSCLVGLVVSCAPSWIKEVKLDTLRKLAGGLIGWQECEMALSLLERGGVACIGSVAQLINLIN